MASLGHVAVGLAAARMYGDGHRPHWRSAVTWSALSMLPDADVIGFSLGVRYEDPWGHRGATHSFAFAVIVGLAAGLIARLRSDRQQRASAWQARRFRPCTAHGTVCGRRPRHASAARHVDGRRAGMRALLAVRSHALLRAVASDSGRADRACVPVVVRRDRRDVGDRALPAALRVRASYFRLHTSDFRAAPSRVARRRVADRIDRSGARSSRRDAPSRQDPIRAGILGIALRQRHRRPVADRGASAARRPARGRLDVSAGGSSRRRT